MVQYRFLELEFKISSLRYLYERMHHTHESSPVTVTDSSVEFILAQVIRII